MCFSEVPVMSVVVRLCDLCTAHCTYDDHIFTTYHGVHSCLLVVRNAL